ncbi:hypothetical protein D1B31_18115 [Neobacillus notoginsengisoli]|uniref:Uncharacterized protein n=1 Tax=Neobacillus notoginsengisoli TaxID=1578198 RepID=A0A417YPS8_9BACI|nr:hypothetical protein D1B31_18115 [Neobacillus notoginsengisoli]
MGYINPLFNDSRIEKSKLAETPKPKIKSNNNKRVTRKDKTHNIKFPVSDLTQMKLKSLCKQAARIYRIEGKQPLSQTKFNTLLLRYGLLNNDILTWNRPYQDSKVYMHTNLLETEYAEIGGPHGLTVRKNISDRKVVYHIMNSVLNWLERGGNLEKII